MKSYFNFSFRGGVYSVDPKFYKTQNGFSYQKIRVVNGNQFNLFFIFEDSDAFAQINKGDLVLLRGSIDKVERGNNYFKVEQATIISKRAAKQDKPSAEKDIHEVLGDEAGKTDQKG